jgi:hypothetical protein
MTLPLERLVPESKKAICEMVLGSQVGQTNMYTLFILDLKERIDRVAEHISKTGRIPRPPALLKRNDQFEVLDGNHRLAAYFYTYGYFNIPINSAWEVRADDDQEYWVSDAHIEGCQPSCPPLGATNPLLSLPERSGTLGHNQ